MFSRSGAVAALVLCVLAAIALLRTGAFASLEPRQDHGAFIQWVRGAAEGTHLLPVQQPGETFMAALQRDEDSVANAVLRPLYLTNILLLKSLAFAVFLAGSWVFGADVPGLVAVSVVVNTAAAGLFAAAALAAGPLRGAARPWMLISIGAVLLGNGFLRSFAPLGDHNVGLLLLAALTLAVMRVEGQARDGGANLAGVRPVAVLLGLATFANHTNFLISAPAVGLTILALGLPWRLTLGAGWRLGLSFALSLLPILALSFVASRSGYLGAEEQGFLGYVTFAREAGYHNQPLLQAMAERAAHWRDTMVAILSWPGLVAAMVGLFGWAVVERVRFPLVLVAMHFLLAIGMSAFSHHLDRTGAYVVPILCIGIGWTLAALMGGILRSGRGLRRVACMLALIAGGGGYGLAQWPVLSDPRSTPLWGNYFRDQGDWQAVQREVSALLPEGSALIPADYAMAHLWGAMRAANERNAVAGVLSALEVRAANGTLASYLMARRSLEGDGRRIFLLLPQGNLAAAEETVRRLGEAAPALEHWRQARLVTVRQWHVERLQLQVRDLILAELVPAHP